MSRYKAYPEYKDSGVEWIGAIPEDWDMWKISHACPYVASGTTPKADDDVYYGGDMPWVTTGELREGLIFDTQKKVTKKALNELPTLRVHPEGSVAIAMYGATIGRLGIFGVSATTNQACCVMPPSTILNNKYLFYWLFATRQEIINLSSGGGQPNVNQEKIASLRVSAPSFQWQEKIANFLDHETARIDTLIAKQQELIKLLKEKRQAVISHAVTKGLNPNAPMRDSGVEWLGEVPEHWDVLATKKFFSLKADPAPDNNDMELLSVYTDIGVRPRKELEEKGNKASTTDGYWIVRKGDLIVNKLLAWMGAVGYSEYDGVTSPAYDILRKKRELNAKFFHYLFRTKIAQSEFKRWSRGIMEMRLRLYFEELGRIPMPFPSKDEQDEIVAEIERLESRFDQLIEVAESSINLSQERRTALISAAVTGKIDVRDWQPPVSEAQAV